MTPEQEIAELQAQLSELQEDSRMKREAVDAAARAVDLMKVQLAKAQSNNRLLCQEIARLKAAEQQHAWGKDEQAVPPEDPRELRYMTTYDHKLGKIVSNQQFWTLEDLEREAME